MRRVIGSCLRSLIVRLRRSKQKRERCGCKIVPSPPAVRRPAAPRVQFARLVTQVSESAVQHKDRALVAHALRAWERTRRHGHGGWFVADAGDENVTNAKRLVRRCADGNVMAKLAMRGTCVCLHVWFRRGTIAPVQRIAACTGEEFALCFGSGRTSLLRHRTRR